jgi:hypothetical protein
VSGACCEAGQGGDARLEAIRADEVTGVEGLGVGVNGSDLVVGCNATESVLPVEANSEAGSAVEQKLVQRGAADPASGFSGKGGLDGGVVVRRGGVSQEANAAQERTFGLIEVMLEIEAEGSKRFERAGKKAFAAGLVDGRFHGVDDFDMKAMACRSYGTGESSWSCTNYHYVRMASM